MASPGANCLEATGVALVDEEVAPLGTATKPIASMYLPKRAKASGAKLDSDSGTAIGFAPLMVLACDAPARLPTIFSNASLTLPSVSALSNSVPLMRGAAATTAPAELLPASAILSI